jgi:CheY-like chemotaxis protein
MEKKLNCMLLVDDDEGHNFLNRLVIEETDITQQVHIAWDGREAMDYVTGRGKFRENGDTYPRPDLILLDINMPGMDGWRFMEEYRQLDDVQKRKTMIVMLTTSENPDDRERAQTIRDISDFRNKPLTQEILEELVRKYFTEYLPL